MNTPEKRVTPEDFIRIWQTSNSTKEVSEKVGIDRSAVRVRVDFYRKRGIPLKKYKNARESLNIEALTKLAKSLSSAEPEGEVEK